jgi:uncharacterized membrane protein YdjX (TVP38/TMEM64 family)
MAKAPYHRLKYGLLLGLALGLTLIGAAILPQSPMIVVWQSVLERIQGLGTTGIIAFVVMYNLATLFFIPGALLTLAGGILYGLFWGSIYVILAATLGATLAFLIGRYFARDWVCRRLRKYPQFRAIDAAVARQGARVVLLTRLSPIFPFNLLNYALGVTGISLKDYVLGSAGMIPGTVMYVYIGAVLEDIAGIGSSPELGLRVQVIQWTFRGLGLAATLAVTLLLTRIAKRALDDEIQST